MARYWVWEAPQKLLPSGSFHRSPWTVMLLALTSETGWATKAWKAVQLPLSPGKDGLVVAGRIGADRVVRRAARLTVGLRRWGFMGGSPDWVGWWVLRRPIGVVRTGGRRSGGGCAWCGPRRAAGSCWRSRCRRGRAVLR